LPTSSVGPVWSSIGATRHRRRRCSGRRNGAVIPTTTRRSVIDHLGSRALALPPIPLENGEAAARSPTRAGPTSTRSRRAARRRNRARAPCAPAAQRGDPAA
jgi:hypothetical protein